MVVALPQSSSWTVTFADLMANFLCLMLLNLALSHTATEKVAPALAQFRTGFHAAPAAAPALAVTVANGGGYWRVWLARRLGDVPSRDALSLADDAPRLYLDLASATQRAVQRDLALLLSGADRPIGVIAAPDTVAAAVQLHDMLSAQNIGPPVRLILDAQARGLAVEIEP